MDEMFATSMIGRPIHRHTSMPPSACGRAHPIPPP